MKCKKCGTEIKEGNTFCTNCGTSINEENINTVPKEKNKTTIKSKLKLILPIIVVIMLIIGTTIFLLNKYKNSDNITTLNNPEQIEKATDKKIEIGKDYNIISDNKDTQTLGFIRFNTETDYIMEIGFEASEEFTKTGNYAIDQNNITLTVNYDSSEYEKTTTPYTEKINILEDDILEYTDRNGIVYKFSKNSTTDNEEQKNSLLDEIYAKYPEYKNKENFICTNDSEYWLLDNNGNKIYFDSLETFESALEKCNTSTTTSSSTTEENTSISTNTINTTTYNTRSNQDEDKYVNISELIGKTEKEAVNIIKSQDIPYKIIYEEDIEQKDGVVLSKTYIYNHETLYIYVNQYKERTLKINLHRSCLAEQFKKRTETTLSEPLNVIVKANDKIIFNEKLTNADLRESNTDDCKTSTISYTGKTPPKITILVNNKEFRTFDTSTTKYWFYYENTPHDLGFTEHGAG